MFGFSKKDTQFIFLDHASTTPVAGEVLEAMRPYWSEAFFNASSIYPQAVRVKKDITDARESIARYLRVRADEIVFTASGTESDNMAILGVVKAYKQKGIARPHIITSTIEHPAVLETCVALEHDGVEVTWIAPRADGRISPEDVYNALQINTVLVSIIHAQNEIGVVQSTKDIERQLQKFKKIQGREDTAMPHLHVDASQSPNYIKCSKEKLGAQLITFDGSKIYGPKGIGMLYVDRRVPCSPLMFGGGQENGMRPGTENTPLIIGFARALELAESMREQENDRLKELQKYCIEKIHTSIPHATINGSIKHRLPNNINVCIPGIDAEFATIALAQQGILCSFMTACKNIGNNLYSYVIEAINPECKSSSLRFTMGRSTRKQDIDALIKALNSIVGK